MQTQLHEESRLSAEARERFVAREGGPPLLSDWFECVMIHYEVDARALQREVPFELDVFEGRTFVSLVAFTMRDLRTRRWPRLGRRLFQPVGSHGFLNIRTYVRVAGEPGIYFLAEFLPNRFSVLLGPAAYGLPYHFGRLDYRHDPEAATLEGCVTASAAGEGDARRCRTGRLEYRVHRKPDASLRPASVGTLTEFLMERYTAYTAWRGIVRQFRIWHPPWPQAPAFPEIRDASLLVTTGEWAESAQLQSANYSPGVADVWMGRPRRLPRAFASSHCAISRQCKGKEC